MKRIRRPILWALGALLLIFIGLAGYAYFIGTRTSILPRINF